MARRKDITVVSIYRAGLATLGASTLGAVPLAIAPAWWLALGLVGVHWVTLSNRRRVALDRDGRIAAGLPETFHGVHVEDVAPLGRQLRAIDEAEASCEVPGAKRSAKTFQTTDGAAKELVAANPSLGDLLESDCSHDCVRYRKWINGGRRGPKPQAGPGDGRFDALNERLELRGKRRVSSWLEAVHVTVPPSRKWEDFRDRLPVLEEATGLSLMLPEGAEVLKVDAETRRACQQMADAKAGELVAEARGGRLLSEEAPF